MANEKTIVTSKIQPVDPSGLVRLDRLAMPANPPEGSVGRAILDAQQNAGGVTAQIDDAFVSLAKTWSSQRIGDEIAEQTSGLFSPTVARWSGTQNQSLSNGGQTGLDWQTEEYNTAGRYNLSGNDITVTVAGVYSIVVAVEVFGVSSGIGSTASLEIYCRKNNSSFAIIEESAEFSNSDIVVSGCAEVYLETTDNLDFTLRPFNTATAGSLQSSSLNSFLAIHRVS